MTALNSSSDGHDEPVSIGIALTELHTVHVSDGRRIAYLEAALAERDQKCENLQAALATARRIGEAIGIVMHAMKITEDEAFELVARASQRTNRKLRLVADDIVLTGTI